MIILQGKEYKSITEATRKHELSYNTLLHRIKKHGNNDPHLLMMCRKTRDFNHGI